LRRPFVVPAQAGIQAKKAFKMVSLWICFKIRRFLCELSNE